MSAGPSPSIRHNRKTVGGGGLSPVGVVNVPLLAQALAHAAGRARQAEVAVGELEGAVGVRLARRLLGAGVVQVCQLELAADGDELPRLEVQEGHGAQGRPGQEVEEPDQVQTHLGGERTIGNLSLFVDSRVQKPTALFKAF